MPHYLNHLPKDSKLKSIEFGQREYYTEDVFALSYEVLSQVEFEGASVAFQQTKERHLGFAFKGTKKIAI